MAGVWSRPVGISDPPGLDYWSYFGLRLVEHAAVYAGASLLDIGCGDGSSLFPAARIIGPEGHATGIEICPG